MRVSVCVCMCLCVRAGVCLSGDRGVTVCGLCEYECSRVVITHIREVIRVHFRVRVRACVRVYDCVHVSVLSYVKPSTWSSQLVLEAWRGTSSVVLVYVTKAEWVCVGGGGALGASTVAVRPFGISGNHQGNSDRPVLLSTQT